MIKDIGGTHILVGAILAISNVKKLSYGGSWHYAFFVHLNSSKVTIQINDDSFDRKRQLESAKKLRDDLFVVWCKEIGGKVV